MHLLARGGDIMNRQHYDLLTKLIYARGDAFLPVSLAQMLGVSPRSIRNYIATINDFLGSNHLHQLQILPNGNLIFDGNQQDVIDIQQHLFQNDFYQYRLSSAERSQIVSLFLLTAEDYITIRELTDRLYISKTTLLKDMETVTEYFSQKGISFYDAKMTGYRLKIDEWTRRELLLEAMDGIVLQRYFLSESAHGMDMSAMYGFVMQMFHGLTRISMVKDAVYQAECDVGIQLNDRELQSIIHGLIVLLTRVGHPVSGHKAASHLFESAGIAERLSQSLGRQLDGKFSCPFSPEEQVYIAYALEHHWLDRKDCDPFSALEVQLATKRFIYAVSKDLGLKLFEDNELQRFLANHLQSWITSGRMRVLSQDAIELTGGQYQDCLTAVGRNFYILEETMGQQSSRFEYDTVLLYITAAVERLRRKRGAPRAIVVCNSGIATAKFLTERLLNCFNIDIVSTTSAHRLDQIRQHYQYDLIITTIPLRINDVPCVWVSPLLNRKDMFQVYDVLNMLASRASPNVNSPDNKKIAQPTTGKDEELGIFLTKCVAVNCHAETWQEAIRIAGMLLPDNGNSKEQYIQEMIRCVEENGPYIVIAPGIALAHAAPPAPDIPFSASMACFTPPVVFHSKDNDPVWCVIALQATNQEEHTKKLFRIMNLACNMEFRELTKTGSIQELQTFIQTFEKNRKEEGHGSF